MTPGLEVTGRVVKRLICGGVRPPLFITGAQARRLPGWPPRLASRGRTTSDPGGLSPRESLLIAARDPGGGFRRGSLWCLVPARLPPALPFSPCTQTPLL